MAMAWAASTQPRSKSWRNHVVQRAMRLAARLHLHCRPLRTEGSMAEAESGLLFPGRNETIEQEILINRFRQYVPPQQRRTLGVRPKRRQEEDIQ